MFQIRSVIIVLATLIACVSAAASLNEFCGNNIDEDELHDSLLMLPRADLVRLAQEAVLFRCKHLQQQPYTVSTNHNDSVGSSSRVTSRSLPVSSPQINMVKSYVSRRLPSSCFSASADVHFAHEPLVGSPHERVLRAIKRVQQPADLLLASGPRMRNRQRVDPKGHFLIEQEHGISIRRLDRRNGTSVRMRQLTGITESIPAAATLADLDDATFALLRKVFEPLCLTARGCTCFNGSAMMQRPLCGQPWIKCDANGNLTGITATGCGLKGQLPEEISQLGTLITLDLEANALSGTIPESIGNLTQLQSLDLSDNSLSGTIPSSLGKLEHLRHLGLLDNQLNGNIPATLGYLSQLQSLNLNNNQLSGSIPPELGKLEQLTELGLSDNQLTGTVPAELGTLLTLTDLNLFGNQLSGSIPSSVGNLSHLIYLDLGNNHFTSIPSEIGQLDQLLILELSSNQLSGSITPELGDLAELLNLGLHGNQLSGSIPESLGNLKQLRILDLSNNKLSGTIPASFSKLTNLLSLSVENNMLSGGFPASLRMLNNLTELNLASNQLSGPLPSFVTWQHLTYIDLHDNMFGGDLSLLSTCTALQVIYASKNLFNGTLASLAQLRQLVVLAVFDNNISGGIQPWLFQSRTLLTAYLSSNPLGGGIVIPPLASASPLEEIDLTNCSVTGAIPPYLSHLTNLTFLSLANNHLIGEIPADLGNLVFRAGSSLQQQLDITGLQAGQLRVLLLGNNKLEGVLPQNLIAPTYTGFYSSPSETYGCSEVGSSSLSVLDVSNNRLTGFVPTAGLLRIDGCGFANVVSRSLVQLILDNNQFIGGLPSDLLLPPMSVLSVANNNFSGSLPPSPGFSTVRLFDVSNNNFSGIIPAEYGSIPALRSLVATGNPNLFVIDCNNTNATVYNTQCLPVGFLTVNARLQESFNDGLTCASVVASNPAVAITVDQRTYLRGVQCTCNATTYQVPRYTTEWQGAPLCASCGSSGWCDCSDPVHAMTGCWASVIGNISAQSASTNASVWQALECPYIASPSVTSCQLKQASVCVPGDLTCQCAVGYSNRRCTQCIDGYFASSRRCELCWSGLRVLLPIGWAVAIAAYVAYLLLVPGSASGVLKITTFYGQSLLLLSENARVPWPPAIASLLHSSSETGSLSATAVECVFRGIGLGSRFVIYTTTPFILVTISLAVFAVNRFFLRRPFAYDVFIYMVLSMLYTTYFSVTLKALAGVSCTLYEGVQNAHPYLNAYPWIPCDTTSPEFRLILALSIVCLLVYTLGSPAFAGYHLFHKRHRLSDESVLRRLGFMYGSYRPSTYWWEYIVLLRRLLLAVAITIIPFTQQQLASAIVMAVLVISIALQHTLAPFATSLENRLEQLSLYVLLMSFLGTYVAETNGVQQTSILWLPVFIIVLAAITAVILVAATAFVLLMRLVPSLATSSTISPLVERSMTLVSLVLKTDELRERLLQPAERVGGSDDNSL